MTENKDFYRDLHKWIQYHYGKATKCVFCNKIGKGREIHWALLKDKKYKRNIENYIQLCVICHGEYDDTLIKKGERRSPATEFKKNERKSPKTEFKKGHIPWNKGHIKYENK